MPTSRSTSLTKRTRATCNTRCFRFNSAWSAVIGSAKNWYPQLVTLSGNPETEFRLTVAWLMGFDNQSPEFHEALLKLLHDPEPIVRRNAALALVRFDDSSGREELVSVLKPYVVEGAGGWRGREQYARRCDCRAQDAAGSDSSNRTERSWRCVRRCRDGSTRSSKPNGSQVTRDEDLLSLNSDEQSVWEALRGLALVGTAEDLPLIQSYANSTEAVGTH